MKPKRKDVVLLIQSDATDREIIRNLLDEEYDLLEAASGEEGMSAVQTDPPNLVLLDGRLLDLDSTTVLTRLVADNIPVIMLTSERRPSIVVAAMQHGAMDYLLKEELSGESLEWAVAGALDRAALKQHVETQRLQISEQAGSLTHKNVQIQSLAYALTLAEQRERRRISRVLHDHIQQLLYAVQMHIHLVEVGLGNAASSEIAGLLSTATTQIEQAISATRTLSVDLSPPIIKGEGLAAVLEWLGRHMEQVHGLQVDLQAEADFDPESEEMLVLIFQMVQELLFNVVKHSNVKEAAVRLFAEDGRYKILVADQGVGFDSALAVPPVWKPEQGYGLFSVRERLELFGGSLEINSVPGDGARITIILPDASPFQAT